MYCDLNDHVSAFKLISLSPSLWLDANDAATITQSGGLVSQWSDKSGNARHASQATSGNRPTYTTVSGVPCLAFSGDQTMSLANNTTSKMAIIVVFRFRGGTSYRGITATGGNSGAGTMMLSSGGTSAWGTYGSGSDQPAGSSLTTNTTYILGMDGQSTGTFYKNGTADGTYSATEGQVTGHIGGSSTGQAITGDLFEVIWIPASLSTVTRQKIEGYLAWKYTALGLVTSLPTGHPYKNAAP